MAATATVERVVLNKQGMGLGFTIRGGTDEQDERGDNSIYITSIKANGAAARSGRIAIGDKVLEINGNDLRMVTHSEAVNHFHQTGDQVNLLIEKRSNSLQEQADQLQNNRLIQSRHRSVWLPVTIVCLIIGLPLTYWILYRKLRR